MTAGEVSARRHTRLSMEHRRNRLERRYQRLLLMYPATYRREHGDEMIGVLLASASGGASHAGDVLDLVAGAVRIRGRVATRSLRAAWRTIRPMSMRSVRSLRSAGSMREGVRDARWTDALAVVSVVAPLLLLVAALTQFDIPQAAASLVVRQPFWPFSGGYYLADWPLTVGGAGVFLLALCRLGRSAGLLAVATGLAQLVALPVLGVASYTDPALAFTVLLSFTAAAGLLLSPGPARGLALVRWWGLAAIGVVALVLGGLSLGGFSLSGTLLFGTSAPFPAVPGSISSTGMGALVPAAIAGLPGDILIAVVLAAAGLLCLLTPVTRRVLPLLAIPVIPYGIIWQHKLATDLIGRLNVTVPATYVTLYLVPLVVAAAIVAGTRVAARRRAAASVTPLSR
jgi:hypothetical protein